MNNASLDAWNALYDAVKRNDAEDLEGTIQQMREINTTNDQIQSDLQISKKLLTRSLKRLYTDKLILCFVFIICALITIIVLSKYNFIELSTS